MEEPRIVTTEDGSDSLYLPEMGEPYHSVHGALAESQHVYLGSGYAVWSGRGPVVLLEVGFGSGLNCVLTALEALRSGCQTTYYTLEKYPLSPIMAGQLNYPRLLREPAASWFRLIHESPWGRKVPVHSLFDLVKWQEDFVTAGLEELPPCHVVYFDAFAPDKQPALWSRELFGKLYGKMVQGGVIVTYSAKGEVRRNLAGAGFRVERLPGPPGKRHMLRGLKL